MQYTEEERKYIHSVLKPYMRVVPRLTENNLIEINWQLFKKHNITLPDLIDNNKLLL